MKRGDIISILNAQADMIHPIITVGNYLLYGFDNGLFISIRDTEISISDKELNEYIFKFEDIERIERCGNTEITVLNIYLVNGSCKQFTIGFGN